MVLEHASWLLPAAREGYKSREEIKSAWDKVYASLFGRKKNIAFTGMAGVGKTVLFDHLSGKAYKQQYAPPLTSQGPEKGKITVPQKRIHISVVPGQEAPPRFDALDKLFSSKKAVDGVIHVVAYGFIEVRGEASQQVLIEKGAATLDEFRKYQLAVELKDLHTTCEIIRQAIHKHHKPKWMLIAVTKSDLYYSSIEKAAKYYSPDGDSEFVRRLKQLQDQVGTDNFTWEALPVCSWLDDFHWNKQTAPSVLKPYQRDHYLAVFAQRLESYCES
jgi:50S ribosome-binding GTPase